MLVSAISQNFGNAYILSNSSKQQYTTKNKETIGDTAFNSLTPFNNKKNNSAENSTQLFENINTWKNFCHKQIVGEKLNVIA